MSGSGAPRPRPAAVASRLWYPAWGWTSPGWSWGLQEARRPGCRETGSPRAGSAPAGSGGARQRRGVQSPRGLQQRGWGLRALECGPRSGPRSGGGGARGAEMLLGGSGACGAAFPREDELRRGRGPELLPGAPCAAGGGGGQPAGPSGERREDAPGGQQRGWGGAGAGLWDSACEDGCSSSCPRS